MSMFNKHRQSGFTLVEVAVVMPILILVVVGFIAALIAVYSQNSQNRTEIQNTAAMATALDQLERNVQYATIFLSTKDTNMSDPYGPNGTGGTWDYKGTTVNSKPLNALIARIYATETPLTSNSQRSLVYKSANGCTAGTITTNAVQTANVIYFVQNGTLFQRYLPDRVGATCSDTNGYNQMQSCPPNLTSPNAICVIEDTVLATNVTSFSVTYRPNFSTAFSDNATTPANLATAKQVKVMIETSQTVDGNTKFQTLERIITRQN